MKIPLVSARGQGPTTLAAFDAALIQAGIANFNLIKLSSVIPPGSTIVQPARVDPGGAWGDRLYIVLAESRVDTPNAEAWAGIGWVQDPDTNKGLFVEHEGSSEAQVRRDMELTLKALVNNRPGEFGEPQYRLEGAVCSDQPVCALVAAVFDTAPWHS